MSTALHLVRRFFQVSFARSLTAAEQARVAAVLDPPQWALFRSQDRADQRHAHTVMTRVAAAAGDGDVLVAALLHDVGKSGLGMGAVARTVATLCARLRLPATRRMRAYADHGRIGAERLAAIGAGPLAVDFARRHPDPDPGPHDPRSWTLLLAADHT